MAQHIYSGSGAPTTTPAGIGHHFIDTTNKQSYISVGTSNSADWKATAGGTEAITLLVEVYNQTGVTLTKGTVVYINGAHASLPTVAKAQANADLTSSKTLGLIKTDISNNSSGFVVASGLLGDLDTSAFVAGNSIYLSAATAGAYTNVEPITPNHSVYLGVIADAHPSQGKIEVKVQNGYELSEIHDVLITAVADGQVIQWDAVNGYWKNVTLDSGDISDFTTAARTASVVNSLAGSQTDQAPSVSATNTALSGKEPTLTKGNLTETTSSVLTITGGTNAVIGSGVTIEVDQADSINDGYLSSTDWNTFNNKEPAVTKGNLTETVSSVLTITGGSNSVIGSGVTVEVSQADAVTDGYLSSTDWGTFNSKLNDVTANAPLSDTLIFGSKVISISQSTSSTDGYLSSLDWIRFDEATKQSIATTIKRKVKNDSGGTLLKGQLVMVDYGMTAVPPTTDVVSVIPLLFSSTQYQCIGILENNISNGSEGFVIVRGIAEDLVPLNPVFDGQEMFADYGTSFPSDVDPGGLETLPVGYVVNEDPINGVYDLLVDFTETKRSVEQSLKNFLYYDTYGFNSPKKGIIQKTYDPSTGNTSYQPTAGYSAIKVANSSGTTIPKGSAVYASGTTSYNSKRLYTVELARADSLATSHDFLGITDEIIYNNSVGNVVVFGLIEDINLSAFAINDQLFLSDSVAGGFRTTAPAGPNTKIFCASVLDNGSSGMMFVYTQRSVHLERLNNVELSSVTGDQVLAYNSTNTRWENQTRIKSIAKNGSSALSGDVTLSAGSNVTLTQVGNDIEIAATGGGGGGVTQIVAGTNITISPAGGTGVVTINASGGGGGGSVPDFLLISAGII